MKPVDVFHIGPQKSGTSWVYQCMKEHPQIACPPRDTIHYYDIFYHRGLDWYASHFADQDPQAVRVDPTPSYIRSPVAPARMAADNPDAKIVVCLRHPIERAFSHYWHEKKKGRFNFHFSEILENYDLFANWLEPGFYAVHLERFLKYFGRQQVLCQLFDDLEQDPRAFLIQFFEFIEVNPEVVPSVVDTKINQASPAKGELERAAAQVLGNLGLRPFASKARQAASRAGLVTPQEKRIERLADVPQDVVRELSKACASEIESLERLLGIDLSRWRRYG